MEFCCKTLLTQIQKISFAIDCKYNLILDISNSGALLNHLFYNKF